MIDLVNRDNIELFIADNIQEYNEKPGRFSAKNLKDEIKAQLGIEEEAPYTDTEIGIYLAEQLRNYVTSLAAGELNLKLDSISGSKDNIDKELKKIADAECFAVSDLKKYYKNRIMKNIQFTYENNKTFKKEIFQSLLTYNAYAKKKNTNDQVEYIKADLKKSVEKALYHATVNGFVKDCVDVNTGTQTANEGDSAQFLFLARAVLAGYTCSNVDVRSARYDAVIDYEGHLLRVQIKGISSTSIQLKDRDRAGAGNDPTVIRNKGKFISSKDSDIYVAVDKQFGTCYIIPTEDIDLWVASNKKSKALSQLQEYKENWEKISEVANKLFP